MATPVHFVALRGTGERHNAANTMLAQVYQATQHPHMAWHDVPYPASIGPVNERGDVFGASLAVSKSNGSSQARRVVAKLRRTQPNSRIVLAGYSLGALAAIKALTDGIKVDRTILIGNPALHHLGDTSGLTPHHYRGVASHTTTDWVTTVQDVHNIAHPADGIAHLHPLSPLHRVAPWLWAMDLDDPGPWMSDLLRRLHRQELLQAPLRIWNRNVGQALREAPNAVIGYATGGTHTTRYGEALWRTIDGTPVSGIKKAALLADEVGTW